MNYVRGEKIRKEIVSIWCRLINSTMEEDNEKTETTTFQSMMIESGGEETTTVSFQGRHHCIGKPGGPMHGLHWILALLDNVVTQTKT